MANLIKNPYSDFLFYPEKLCKTTKLSGDSETYDYFFQHSDADYSVAYEYGEDTHTLFGRIDDSEATYKNLVCKAGCNDEDKEFRGADRLEEAEAWLNDEFEKYNEKNYPQGLHWVAEEGKTPRFLFLGNMLIAKIQPRSEDDQMVFDLVMQDMHKHKFFLPEEYQEMMGYGVRLPITDDGNGDAHAIIAQCINLVDQWVDIPRYEQEKTAALAAKLEKSREVSEFLGLPDLTGSEKQVRWGEQIRAEFLIKATQKQLGKLVKLKTPAKAKFWIDHRDNLDEKIKG